MSRDQADDGQPITGPYDDRELPRQGEPAAPRCHVCNGPRAIRHGVLMCRICDAPPMTP